MLKKMMLLAMAVGALVAFAAPAVASANGAIQDTETLETAEDGTEIEYTGTVTFSGALGGFKECMIHAVITTSENGSTGDADVEITQSTCVGTGAFTACKVESASTEPWHVDVNTTDLTATEVFIDGTNDPECGKFGPFGAGSLEDVDLSFPEITLTPASAPSLDTLTVSGSGKAIIGKLGGAETSITASGSLTAVDQGTWQIEEI